MLGTRHDFWVARETTGKANWVPPVDGVSAHTKVDEDTGDNKFHSAWVVKC